MEWWYCLGTQSCPVLCDPYGLLPTMHLCAWDFPSKNTGVGCHFLSPEDLPHPGVELASPVWQAGPLPGKPDGWSGLLQVVSLGL